MNKLSRNITPYDLPAPTRGRYLLFILTMYTMMFPYIETPEYLGLGPAFDLLSSTGMVKFLWARRGLDVISFRGVGALLATVFVVVEAQNFYNQRRRLRWSRIEKALAWFLFVRLVLYIGHAHNTDSWQPAQAIANWTAFAAFFGACAFFATARVDAHRLLNLLVKAIILSALTCILQMAHGALLGYSLATFRPGGLFADAVVCSQFIIVGIALVFEGYGFESRMQRSFAFVALLVAMAATGSEGSWLLLIIDLLVLRVLRFARTRGKFSRRPAPAPDGFDVSLALCVLGFFVWFSYFLTANPEVAILDPRRIQKWILASQLFHDNQLFGIGVGRFLEWDLHNISIYAEVGTSAHSLYLEMLAELGWTGQLLIMLPLFIYLANYVRHALTCERSGSSVNAVVLLLIGAAYIGFAVTPMLQLLVCILISCDIRNEASWRARMMGGRGLHGHGPAAPPRRGAI